jgi:tricorn protease
MRFLLLLVVLVSSSAFAQGFKGYYRDPVLHGDTLVFVAEGDLWKVPIAGGIAQRLTTHPAEESHPMISPDGSTIAFIARYEGPAEVYTMPFAGGLPVRRTYEGDGGVATATFKPNGELVYATQHYATLPDPQLVSIDLKSNERTRIPLSNASEGAYDSAGKTLYFVRPGFHANVTRWYTGGQARQIWKFRDGATEAEKLTRDYKGESHSPLWWQGRVYFISDRDRTMNMWSMNEAGGDLKQHTDHRDWDARFASLDNGRITYVVGADIWIYDIAANSKRLVPVALASDLDQLREKWVTRRWTTSRPRICIRRAIPSSSRHAAGSSSHRRSPVGSYKHRARPVCAIATSSSCRTARRCSACRMRAASSNSCSSRRTASARSAH